MTRRGVVVRAAIVLLVLALAGGVGFSWYVAGALIQPAMHPFEPAPPQLGAADVTFVHGAEDRHTRIEEARREFTAAAEPKTMSEVPGAAHVDLHAFIGQEYERRIDAFFAEKLARR